MKYRLLIAATFFVCLSSFAQEKRRTVLLFNGKNLNNWDKYLGPAFPGKDSIAKLATPDNVYSVVQLEGQNVIRISGEVHGSIATKKAFKNYHLRMVFKWGKEITQGRNSGMLYHSYDPFGASYWTWMGSMEFQLMHGSLGDAYPMVDEMVADSKVKTGSNGDVFFYNPEGNLMAFGQNVKRRMIKASAVYENTLGQWNTLDLYCLGNKSVHVVNGNKVMELENIGVLKGGEFQSLTKGKIQLQSEGAELFVKSMELEEIKDMPSGL